jgi:hypothetical protein
LGQRPDPIEEVIGFRRRRITRWVWTKNSVKD